MKPRNLLALPEGGKTGERNSLMLKKPMQLLERLEHHKLFTFACFLYPDFGSKTRCAATGRPYSRSQAEVILYFCHLKIIDAVSNQLPGTEDLQGLDIEYLSSPRALSLAIENTELCAAMKERRISVAQAIEISRLDM